MINNNTFVFIFWTFLWIPILGNINNTGTQYNFIWYTWVLLFTTLMVIKFVLPRTKLGLDV